MLHLTLFLCLFGFVLVEAVVFSSDHQFSVTATSSNASTRLFTNTTSTNQSSFSYIIPYGQSQECNIYGRICQTGSITVGVNLTTTTTSTVLPCSSYLTAQSRYLTSLYMSDFDYSPGTVDGDNGFTWLDTPEDWQINFGQSPECRSYAQEIVSGQYNNSDCGIPPTVGRRFSPEYTGYCCGNCSLNISEVRLYYFPESTTAECQQNQTSNSSSILSAGNLNKRAQSLVGDGSVAVVGGHTFTSPSVYLQILGTAAVNDLCNTIGPVLTDPIMTFPPGVLSTWKPLPSSDLNPVFSFGVGDVWDDPEGLAGEAAGSIVAPLNVKDLACPTWGLGVPSTSADGTVFTTIGPPWLPLIIPPIEVFSLNSIWASRCTGLLTDPFELNTFVLYDPPIALTRESALGPVATPTPFPATNLADPTTVPDEQAASSTPAAEPANSPKVSADPPARTGDPGRNSPSPSAATAGPARPGSPPSDPAATPTDRGDSSSPPEVQAGGYEDSSNGQDEPSVDPKVSRPDATQAAPADPKTPAQPAPQQVDDSQPLTQGLGAIIYNAFGKSGPEVGEIASKVNTIVVPTAGVQKVSIDGGQVLSADPSGIEFKGKTYSIGGPAMTLSNSVYTLVPQKESGANSADDDQKLSDPLPVAPGTLTIAGQAVVPNPAGVVIAGSSVLPGGSAVTMSNTPISLDPSRILVVGSSSFSLPPQSVFTVGTQPFTANPTGFTLNGATITPGGTAQIVDGTTISLGQSGALAIDSTTVSLPNSSPTPPVLSAFTVAGQTFTPNPTAFSIAGTTISLGGPAATIGGTIISLQPSGTLIVGSSTIPLSATSTPSRNTVLVVASQTFTPNPTSFSIAGTTISAGGAPVTIAGTTISLQSSGTLIIGSSTIPLLAPQTPAPSLLNIHGLEVEAQSSLAIVDGVTISPGAPGLTINGSVVSLEAGGATLDVGTGHFAMPTGGASNGSGGFVAFEGGQGRGVEVSLLSILLFGVGGTFMTLVW